LQYLCPETLIWNNLLLFQQLIGGLHQFATSSAGLNIDYFFNDGDACFMYG
jgi:hypothetical protein